MAIPRNKPGWLSPQGNTDVGHHPIVGSHSRIPAKYLIAVDDWSLSPVLHNSSFVAGISFATAAEIMLVQFAPLA